MLAIGTSMPVGPADRRGASSFHVSAGDFTSVPSCRGGLRHFGFGLRDAERRASRQPPHGAKTRGFGSNCVDSALGTVSAPENTVGCHQPPTIHMLKRSVSMKRVLTKVFALVLLAVPAAAQDYKPIDVN